MSRCLTRCLVGAFPCQQVNNTAAPLLWPFLPQCSHPCSSSPQFPCRHPCSSRLAQFWRQNNGGALSGEDVVALAIEPGAVVNEVFDVTPPYPDAPGILAGFLFDNVALTMTEQGSDLLERQVLKRWAKMMNDDRILTEVGQRTGRAFGAEVEWKAVVLGMGALGDPST